MTYAHWTLRNPHLLRAVVHGLIPMESVERSEAKYKACRAAFLEMGRMQNREKKERIKERQRIVQLCKDGIDAVCPAGKKMWSMLNAEEQKAVTQFQKILGLLGVSGYEPPRD